MITFDLPESLSPDFALNVLQVSIDSEIEFLTDALADASHPEDVKEYAVRLASMNQFKMMFTGNFHSLKYAEGDPSIEHLAMAIDKLRMDQCELLSDPTEADSHSEFEKRITAAELMLNELCPKDFTN